MRELEPLVGDWSVVMRFPPDSGLEDLHGTTSFAWTLDGAYLLQTATADDPAPDVTALIARDGDGYLQHYFDSRGVVRLYAMGFGDGAWTLSREAEAPDFSQRFRVALEGDVMTGAWERTEDGAWMHDFDIVYTRVRG